MESHYTSHREKPACTQACDRGARRPQTTSRQRSSHPVVSWRDAAAGPEQTHEPRRTNRRNSSFIHAGIAHQNTYAHLITRHSTNNLQCTVKQPAAPAKHTRSTEPAAAANPASQRGTNNDDDGCANNTTLGSHSMAAPPEWAISERRQVEHAVQFVACEYITASQPACRIWAH